MSRRSFGSKPPRRSRFTSVSLHARVKHERRLHLRIRKTRRVKVRPARHRLLHGAVYLKRAKAKATKHLRRRASKVGVPKKVKHPRVKHPRKKAVRRKVGIKRKRRVALHRKRVTHHPALKRKRKKSTKAKRRATTVHRKHTTRRHARKTKIKVKRKHKKRVVHHRLKRRHTRKHTIRHVKHHKSRSHRLTRSSSSWNANGAQQAIQVLTESPPPYPTSLM